MLLPSADSGIPAVLPSLAVDGLGAVAEPVERPGDQLPLAGREALRGVATPAAAPAAGFGLFVVPSEGSYLEKIDVARGAVATAIRRGRVIGNQIARLESQLLEKQGMGRAGIRRRSSRSDTP